LREFGIYRKKNAANTTNFAVTGHCIHYKMKMEQGKIKMIRGESVSGVNDVIYFFNYVNWKRFS
jgi:hypothetical protein